VFLCSGEGKTLDLSDEYFHAPSYDTGRIQESHITAGHFLMKYIENQPTECDFISLKTI